nr:uncharacterized protein LOC109730082 [Microcebus murinus]
MTRGLGGDSLDGWHSASAWFLNGPQFAEGPASCVQPGYYPQLLETLNKFWCDNYREIDCEETFSLIFSVEWNMGYTVHANTAPGNNTGVCASGAGAQQVGAGRASAASSVSAVAPWRRAGSASVPAAAALNSRRSWNPGINCAWEGPGCAPYVRLKPEDLSGRAARPGPRTRIASAERPDCTPDAARSNRPRPSRPPALWKIVFHEASPRCQKVENCCANRGTIKISTMYNWSWEEPEIEGKRKETLRPDSVA